MAAAVGCPRTPQTAWRDSCLNCRLVSRDISGQPCKRKGWIVCAVVRSLLGWMRTNSTTLCGFVEERSIPAGEEFIRQDDIGDRCFVLASGQAAVLQRDEDDEIVLSTVGPGECLGELGYFSDGRRSASVRALEDLEVLELYYTDLQRAS